MWHWKKNHLWTASALALLAGSASAQFTETFDTYTLGQLDGQGPWNGWDGTPTIFAQVSNAQSQSGTQSVELNNGCDSVAQFQGQYTSGQWTVETWVYVPTGMIGKTYFIVLNTYADGGPYEWSGQIGFNGSVGRMQCDCGGALPVEKAIVFDTWVDLRLEYDLDADNVDIFYNTASDPNPIASYPISMGVFGGDAFTSLQIEAIDLYPDGVTFPQVTELYMDDISITGLGDSGSPACFGGPGANCGCGNTGAANEGCENSTGNGAVLVGTGIASLTADSLELTTTQIPNSPGLTFQANNLLNPAPTFGDGIRCCGGSVVRLITVLAQGNCASSNQPAGCGTQVGGMGGPIASHPGNNSLQAGDTRCYQHWYRDPGTSNPCGVEFFNLSNGWVVTWSA